MSYSDLSTTFFSNGVNKQHPLVSLEFQNLKIDNSFIATNISGANVISCQELFVSPSGANITGGIKSDFINVNTLSVNSSGANITGGIKSDFINVNSLFVSPSGSIITGGIYTDNLTAVTSFKLPITSLVAGNLLQLTNAINGNSQWTNSTTNFGITNFNSNLVTLNGTGTLNLVPDNSYFASPLLSLTNNAYTGIMSLTVLGQQTVSGLFNVRIDSRTGTNTQCYSSQLQFVSSYNTSTMNYSLSNNIPMSAVDSGTLSSLFTGTTSGSTLHLYAKPSSSLTNPVITTDLNGYIQSNTSVLQVTFP